MIKIDFKENIENYNHDDSMIMFPTINRDFLGDSYWYSDGVDNYNDFSDVVKFILSSFKKDYDRIKRIGIGHSYFWFFHFFDECNQGVLITNLDNSKFKLTFVVKIVIYFDEFIFEDEEYFLDREAFIQQLEQELNKY